MTKWHDRSPCEIEARRLKNRLRQQRYRARKREEKSKVGDRPIVADLFITSLPNVTNGIHLLKHNLDSIDHNIHVDDGTRLIESRHEDLGKCDRVCSPIKTDLLQEACTAKLEDQQQKQETHQSNVRFVGAEAVGESFIIPRDNNSFASEKIPELLPEMEQGCVNTQMECDPLVETPDQREQGRILARRLKNRERQRRYRARRRLQADMKKVQLVPESTLPLLELQPSSSCFDPVNRVRCLRNWKEDARRAHAKTGPKVVPTELHYVPAIESMVEQPTNVVSESTSTDPQSSVTDFASENQRCMPLPGEKVEQPESMVSELTSIELQSSIPDFASENPRSLPLAEESKVKQPEAIVSDVTSTEPRSSDLDFESENQRSIPLTEEAKVQQPETMVFKSTSTKPQSSVPDFASENKSLPHAEEAKVEQPEAMVSEVTSTEPQSSVCYIASQNQRHIQVAEEANAKLPEAMVSELTSTEPQSSVPDFASENISIALAEEAKLEPPEAMICELTSTEPQSSVLDFASENRSLPLEEEAKVEQPEAMLSEVTSTEPQSSGLDIASENQRSIPVTEEAKVEQPEATVSDVTSTEPQSSVLDFPSENQRSIRIAEGEKVEQPEVMVFESTLTEPQSSVRETSLSEAMVEKLPIKEPEVRSMEHKSSVNFEIEHQVHEIMPQPGKEEPVVSSTELEHQRHILLYESQKEQPTNKESEQDLAMVEQPPNKELEVPSVKPESPVNFTSEHQVHISPMEAEVDQPTTMDIDETSTEAPKEQHSHILLSEVKIEETVDSVSKCENWIVSNGCETNET